MDYEEEQTNEIEALQSIYTNELTVVSTEPCHCFQVEVVSQQVRGHEAESVKCTIQFEYTSKYPEEAPIMEIVSSENLEDNEVAGVLDLINQQASENLGMVMVFTIVSAVQEHLTHLIESAEQRRLDEIERLVREKEEAEQKRFEGTRVTVESFMVWKTKFEAELAAIKRLKGKEDVSLKKLTGKELFMQDHTLDDSDINFLEEGGEVVEVDESLFEDIDDLTLDGEDEEEVSVLSFDD